VGSADDARVTQFLHRALIIRSRNDARSQARIVLLAATISSAFVTSMDGAFRAAGS